MTGYNIVAQKGEMGGVKRIPDHEFFKFSRFSKFSSFEKLLSVRPKHCWVPVNDITAK